MTSIEEKIGKLSPAGQDAAEAFIDFLLSREKGEEYVPPLKTGTEQEYFSLPKPAMPLSETTAGTGVSHAEKTGIILAEERMIEEKDDVIDFADINARFTQKRHKKDESRPVRPHKPLDWL
jgi:hypothetical protein